jgi:3-hydroxy acid dehydrogenase / malonic semialdehyde reductase
MDNKKTVLITGASSGIGAACSEMFAKNGYRLILIARNRERLSELAAKLKELYDADILSFATDITNRSAIEGVLSTRPSQFSKIDILINNAGLALGKNKIQDGEISDWERMIDTNIKGLLYVTRAVLPEMIAANCGHIVNLGSIASRENYVGGNVYCATKAAVRALNDSFKKDLTGTNVRVSSIDPGMVETEFSKVRFKGDDKLASEVYAGMTPLVAEDIADIIFFCTTRSPHVNISEILVLPTDQSGATLVSRKAI